MARTKLTEEEKQQRQQQKEQQLLKKETELKGFREELKTYIDELDISLLESFYFATEFYKDGLTKKEVFELLLTKFSNSEFEFKKITRYE